VAAGQPPSTGSATHRPSSTSTPPATASTSTANSPWTCDLETTTEEVGQAIAFLTWLHGRDRTLAACLQADVDAWYASSYTAYRLTHAFLGFREHRNGQ
jgi:hypothetical protein